MNFHRLAQASLGLGGIVLMGMGAYFAALRPPFLPEDMRYVGISLTELHTAIPRFLPWISRVFDVLGGYMFATGLLTTALAAASFRSGKPLPTAIVVISGLASIGWMAATNFLINSDFKWLLLAFTLPWLIAIMSSLAPDVRDSNARTYVVSQTMNGAVLQPKIFFKSRLRRRLDDRQSALNRRFEMTHDAKPVEQKAASDGCCGGKSKDNTPAPAVAKPDAKPADDPKHADHKKTGGSCC